MTEGGQGEDDRYIRERGGEKKGRMRCGPYNYGEAARQPGICLMGYFLLAAPTMQKATTLRAA